MGFSEVLRTVRDTVCLYFTVLRSFTETATEWAKTLQELVTTNKYSSVEEAMNQLADTMTQMVSDLDVG